MTKWADNCSMSQARHWWEQVLAVVVNRGISSKCLIPEAHSGGCFEKSQWTSLEACSNH